VNDLRNNRVIRAGAFLFVTISPAIIFIALLRIWIDPILFWMAQNIRPYLGAIPSIMIFALACTIAVMTLLYHGLGLAWRLIKPNLPELNGMIHGSEEFLRYSPNDPYHSGRLRALERLREQRFGVPAPKRESNPAIPPQ